MLDLEPEPTTNLLRDETTRIGGSRQSKRVMAVQEEDQPTRITRQRTREISSALEDSHAPTTDPQDGSSEDAANNQTSQPNNQNRQPNNQNSVADEGKLLYLLSSIKYLLF